MEAVALFPLVPVMPIIIHGHSLKNISVWIFNNRNDYLMIDNEYLSNDKKIKFYHKKCESIFFMVWGNFYSGQGCPICSGKIVSDKNRLSTLYPEISLEWHPYKNRSLLPQDVSYGSTKKVWWICKNKF